MANSSKRKVGESQLFSTPQQPASPGTHRVDASGLARDGQGRQVQFAYVSQSPWPDPVVLKGYEDQIPGSAKLLLEQALKQSNHRMDLEKRVTNDGTYRSWGGLISAFILCVLFLLASYDLILKGHDTAGASILTVTIVSLAGTFIYGTRSQRKERDKKAELMSQALSPKSADIDE